MASRWPWASRIAAIDVRPLVAILALVLVVQASAGAKTATSAGFTTLQLGSEGAAQDAKRRHDSIRRQLATRVPPGSKVFRGPLPAVEWEQRIPQYALMSDIIVVNDRSSADVEVSIVNDAHYHGGVRLVVTPLR
ncbi:MAG TPA: hypothetical protein VK453_08790 [Micromonosporaceae bacterium]|nr:hypothetical protein [Micromonosporaceae bacterium]